MRQGVRGGSVLVAAVAVAWVASGLWGESPSIRIAPSVVEQNVLSGEVMLELEPQAFLADGLDFAIRSHVADGSSPRHLTSTILPGSVVSPGEDGATLYGSIKLQGAILFSASGRRMLVGNLSLQSSPDGTWRLYDTLDANGPQPVFDIGSITLDAPKGIGGFRLAGELLIAPEYADRLVVHNAAGKAVGRVVVSVGQLQLESTTVLESATGLSSDQGQTAGAIGPDVIVGNLYQTSSWGSTGGISAFSLGTISCNVGDEWLNWQSETNQHPVIGQNMFRLKDGRFEHVGQSWVKHGFFALSETLCFNDCQGTNGTHLGVHCSDPYSSNLNGTQFNLGPKYQIDANSGFFPYPPASPPFSGNISRRLQVHNSDLDPALNGGGMYFIEGQYVTPDDSAAGNQDNNASYRRITVGGGGSSWSIALTSTIQREQAALRAWKDTDPSVVETDIRVPNEGLFIMGATVTDLNNGYWHYEYAVQNLNSDRSARGFSVPVDPTAKIRNVAFHDVSYHSGEPWFGTDWPATVSNGYITWITADFESNSLANALRWGTLYNFRFDANRAPQSSDIVLTLYKPGTPASVSATTVGPITNTNDCNGNQIADSLDIANQTSFDCDGNLVPDECETEELSAVQVATGLNAPVYVTAPEGDASRLFIVERGGVIKILTGDVVLPIPFLDIASQTVTTGEQGLLSMAFHPDYANNGYFYVYYTNLGGDSAIAQFTVSGDPNVANGSSQIILKIIDQTLTNHQGGQIQFDPDGMLVVGMGDGGGGFDPNNNAQDTGSLLGKMLRLDVDSPPDYIPIDNPFVGAGPPLDEIWSIGWRNPWRFSFDRQTGDLYVGDVGQDTLEEIDFEHNSSLGAGNYGWRCMEGTSCTGLSGCSCSNPLLVQPIVEFGHGSGDCSVTGGYVYRGCALPNYQGTYFYADFCSDRIKSFKYTGGNVTNHFDRTAELIPPQGPISSIVSFGEDGLGELYIVSIAGSVYKIVPLTPSGICGNSAIEPGEECDDGGTVPGDGCSATCHSESAPSNDNCASAQPIGDGSYLFSTAEATSDGPDETANCPDTKGPLTPDIWYCYTASCTGTATASLCGSTFDTMIAAYEGCVCPPAAAPLDCQDDNCGGSSLMTFSVQACQDYTIRVGGFDGLTGSGTLVVSCAPDPIVTDCDGNNVDDADDIACGTLLDNDLNGIPDICQIIGDSLQGGRLYDRWWSVVAAAQPSTDHPLWAFRPDQVSNSTTGAETWRCSECHGWDYKGVDGEYAAGPHRTGIPGVFGTTKTVPELITLLTDPPSNGGGPGVLNGHDYGSVLASQRIDDLVAFLVGRVVDTDDYIDPATQQFLGDPVAGEVHYNAMGTTSRCSDCHGPTGGGINFGTPQDPEYLGTVAINEPLHFLHRARLGFPGVPMLGWIANGGTDQGAADMGRYAQIGLAVDCLVASQCDDSVACTVNTCSGTGRCTYVENNNACPSDGDFCNGPEVCNAVNGCVAAGSPCWDPGSCNEMGDTCGCDAPTISVAGPRYLAITPQPTSASTAMRLMVTADCPTAPTKYLGEPQPPFNIAPLINDVELAPRLTPAQWGSIVYVTGTYIAPELQYFARSECGLPDAPVYSPDAAATIGLWGDVVGPGSGVYGPPNGVVDAIDIVAMIDAFKMVPNAPPLFAVDIFSCSPNQVLDAIDIVGVIDAFKEVSYRETSCPGPCW